MQVSYCGLCRGHGKIFVALRISSVDDACVVRFRSEGEAVGRLPCDTYEENGLRIAALPVVDFDQALVVEEVDSSGAVGERSERSSRLGGRSGNRGSATASTESLSTSSATTTGRFASPKTIWSSSRRFPMPIASSCERRWSFRESPLLRICR